MNALPFIPAPAVTGISVLAFLHTLKGPDFLALYFGWFIVTLVTVWVLRANGRDTPGVTWGGVLAFEGFGIARIIDGSRHGMHNWTFLIVAMAIGAFFFFLRFKHFDAANRTGRSSCSTTSITSCGGGSSGGDGGGGGGCGGGGGGCGGCGG